MKSRDRIFQNVSDTRRKTMSRIRRKDTLCEIVLRHALWKKGYRYRKNYKCLPGTPDICLSKYKIAIFCDSDFFHGRDWETKLKNKVSSGNNSKYWLMKIEENINRDSRIDSELNGLGWKAIHFWSSDIMKNLEQCIITVDEAVFETIIDSEEKEDGLI